MQHQFEDTAWAHEPAWSHPEAALHGSSHYDLPPVLRWITANIGVHHVHHLNSRIPYYRLHRTLRDHPQLNEMGRLTLIESDMRRRNVVDFPFSGPDFEDMRHSATQFEEIAGIFSGRAVVRDDSGEPALLTNAAVTPNFIHILGGHIALGRDFTDADAKRVISYKDMRGNAYAQPVWQIILHLVNHGTPHRGQISGFLRSMGHTPPPLDLIAYYRTL